MALDGRPPASQRRHVPAANHVMRRGVLPGRPPPAMQGLTPIVDVLAAATKARTARPERRP
jgi:hypothetical protein